MILVTRVSAPLGQLSTSISSSGDCIPIPLTGASRTRSTVRLMSAVVLVYTWANLWWNTQRISFVQLNWICLVTRQHISFMIYQPYKLHMSSFFLVANELLHFTLFFFKIKNHYLKNITYQLMAERDQIDGLVQDYSTCISIGNALEILQ